MRLQVCLYILQIVFFSGEISEEQETGTIRSSFTQLHVILNLFDCILFFYKMILVLRNILLCSTEERKLYMFGTT